MEKESCFCVRFHCVFRSTQRTVTIESVYQTIIIPLNKTVVKYFENHSVFGFLNAIPHILGYGNNGRVERPAPTMRGRQTFAKTLHPAILTQSKCQFRDRIGLPQDEKVYQHL